MWHRRCYDIMCLLGICLPCPPPPPQYSKPWLPQYSKPWPPQYSKPCPPPLNILNLPTPMEFKRLLRFPSYIKPSPRKKKKMKGIDRLKREETKNIAPLPRPRPEKKNKKKNKKNRQLLFRTSCKHSLSVPYYLLPLFTPVIPRWNDSCVDPDQTDC